MLQIEAHKLVEQLIALKAANLAPRVLMTCNIGRITREQIADQLIDGIVALLPHRSRRRSYDHIRLRLILAEGEHHCFLFIHLIHLTEEF